MLSINKTLELAKVHQPVCVSIYLPTQKKGMQVLNREDQLMLKNMLAQIKQDVASRFKAESEVESFVKPLTDLVNDGDLWRNLDEGLAVFLSPNQLQHFKLPYNVESHYYISSNFILWPLIDYIDEREEYFLLALNLDSVKLYRGTKFSFREILTNELNEIEFDQVIGTDHEQKSLQYHGASSGFVNTTYHGHGEGKDDLKEEILKYYRQVDSIVNDNLKDRTTPMILAGLDHLVGIYRKVDNYKHTIAEFLAGNPQDKRLLQIQDEAWTLVAPRYDQIRKQKAEMIEQNLGTARADSQIDRIIPAVLAGKVDTVLLRNKKDIWGIYDPAQGKVRIDDGPSPNNTSLTNLVAMETLSHGGRVYITEGKYIPDETMDLVALYRY